MEQIAKNSTEWGKIIRERDKEICQRCKRYEPGQTPHHIKPKGRYPELSLHVSNGVYLGMRCHDWVHRNPRAAHYEGFIYIGKYDAMKGGLNDKI